MTLTRDLTVPERMALFTEHVGHRSGLSPRATRKLGRRLLSPRREPGIWHAPDPAVAGPLAPQLGRRLRTRFVGALRRQLTGKTGLESALREAVLLDELALLPPRQRFTLWSVMVDRRSVAEIADHTGWTPAQVARLLRAALTTITLRTR